MKIFLGADHRGYDLKEKIKGWLDDWGYRHIDMGAHSLEPDDDYPDFIIKVAENVAKHANFRGIVLGHTGQGEAIAANKYPGIRTAVYYGGPEEIIKLSRAHNDVNILSLGASFLEESETKKVLKLWLVAEFSGEPRHRRRLQRIKAIEKNFRRNIAK